jgi:DNA-binding MarR family transcriptional regulator
MARGSSTTKTDPDAVLELFSEVRLLFHRGRALMNELHSMGESSAGQRAVLESIARRGPQTVPQLARARPVSRQHIQALVNALEERALVRLVHNPAHKRSHLVELTRKGAALLGEMQRRERSLLQRMDLGISPAELSKATAVLARLRMRLEAGVGDRFGRK